MTPERATEPASRVIVLGASNVSLAWPQLMNAVLRRCRRPVHILTAHGMGRSYLGLSRFGLRSAPGILDCGLWPAVNTPDAPPPAAALITDLGNDLVYGRSAEEVVQAAADVISRIRARAPDCRIALTRPPIDSVESLSAWRFHLFRLALFPFCRLSLQQIRTATQQLDEGLQALDGVTLAAPERTWFGFDPIHILRRFRESAFETYVASWGDDAHDELPAEAYRQRPTMEIRWILGREYVRSQPSVTTRPAMISAW